VAVVRGVELRVECTGEAWVKGEVFLLVQAVVNLVQNAVEFSPKGGIVTVRVALEGGWMALEVEDGGPGVPEFAKERIFERFYSLPRPETGRKSTGLGLSFVREIAALHGGSVTVGNRAEGGARAGLRLPRVG
jgi:two-component system, OmpR family, sensor histidine kinase CreC